MPRFSSSCSLRIFNTLRYSETSAAATESRRSAVCAFATMQCAGVDVANSVTYGGRHDVRGARQGLLRFQVAPGASCLVPSSTSAFQVSPDSLDACADAVERGRVGDTNEAFARASEGDARDDENRRIGGERLRERDSLA